MAANPEKKRYTFEQYLLLLQNGKQRLEYDHGDIYAMAGSTSNHARISFNMCRELDDALGDAALCQPYMVDKVVRVTPDISFMPDVVVTCDPADHGEAFFLDAPCIVVEVLSTSTEARDRTYKLLRYQAKASIQVIIFISQYIQHIEVITRIAEGWDFQEYGPGQTLHLASLDIEIEVAHIYRRTSVPPEMGEKPHLA
jgi:Uma2 family endonuclease